MRVAGLRPVQVCYVPHYVPYATGLALQEFLVERRATARKCLRDQGVSIDEPTMPSMTSELQTHLRVAQTDVLLLLQHTSVYTLGRRNDAAVSVAQQRFPEADVFATKRGGLLTYHGPGQLVGYPIIDLGLMNVRLHAYPALYALLHCQNPGIASECAGHPGY